MGTDIPHLCHRPEPGYRPDGNCRVCMVEIEGERVLAPSCKRMPAVGMKVHTETAARHQGPRHGHGAAGGRPARPRHLARPDLRLLELGRPHRGHAQPLPRDCHAGRTTPATPPCASTWTPASSATCASAPAARSRSTTSSAWPTATPAARSCSTSTIPWAQSTCVACGECVQACPTGALMPAAYLNEAEQRVAWPDRKVDSLCPYCGVGCQVTYEVAKDKVVYATGPRRPGQPQPALRQGPLRLRLHPPSRTA